MKLSAELQEKIRVMTVNGVRRGDIANELKIPRNSVYRWQKRATKKACAR